MATPEWRAYLASLSASQVADMIVSGVMPYREPFMSYEGVLAILNHAHRMSHSTLVLLSSSPASLRRFLWLYSACLMMDDVTSQSSRRALASFVLSYLYASPVPPSVASSDVDRLEPYFALAAPLVATGFISGSGSIGRPPC